MKHEVEVVDAAGRIEALDAELKKVKSLLAKKRKECRRLKGSLDAAWSMWDQAAEERMDERCKALRAEDKVAALIGLMQEIDFEKVGLVWRSFEVRAELERIDRRADPCVCSPGRADALARGDDDWSNLDDAADKASERRPASGSA
jgi:hypothetical protein